MLERAGATQTTFVQMNLDELAYASMEKCFAKSVSFEVVVDDDGIKPDEVSKVVVDEDDEVKPDAVSKVVDVEKVSDDVSDKKTEMLTTEGIDNGCHGQRREVGLPTNSIK